MNKFLRYYIGRLLVGNILRGINYLTRKPPIVRSAAEQAKIDAACERLELYHFADCPFCIKVLRYMYEHNIRITLRDAAKETKSRDALIAGGGRYQVPCLRIPAKSDNESWLYESDDIIAYFDKNLGS